MYYNYQTCVNTLVKWKRKDHSWIVDADDLIFIKLTSLEPVLQDTEDIKVN